MVDHTEPAGAITSGRADEEGRPTVSPAKDLRDDKRAGPRVAVADRPQPLEIGNPVDLERALEGMVAEPTHSPGPDERAVEPAEELEDTTAAGEDDSSTDQTSQGLYIGKVGQSLADILKPIPSDGDPARKEKIIYEGLNPNRRPKGAREAQRLYAAEFPMSWYMQSEALGNGMDKWHQRYPGVQYNDEGAVFFKAVYEERGRFFSIYAGKQFEYKPGEVVRSRYVFGPKYADEPLEWRRGISVGNEWVAHQYGKKWGRGSPYKILALWVPHSEITKINLKGGYHPGKINVKSALVLGEVKYGMTFIDRKEDRRCLYEL